MSPLSISVAGFPPASFLGSSSVAAPLAFLRLAHVFLSEAQDRGLERMEGRGLGALGICLKMYPSVYVFFLL